MLHNIDDTVSDPVIQRRNSRADVQLKKNAVVKSDALRPYHAQATKLLSIFNVNGLTFCAQADAHHQELLVRVQTALRTENLFAPVCSQSVYDDANDIVQVCSLTSWCAVYVLCRH